MICACTIVLTTLILVAGTLGAITIVLTHSGRVVTSETQPVLDREPLFGNEVPNLPEATIRIKIDDGGLWPPTEPVTPDLIAVDDDEIIKVIDTDYLPTSTKIPVDGPHLDQENDEGSDNGSGSESEKSSGAVGYSESDSDSSASNSDSSASDSDPSASDNYSSELETLSSHEESSVVVGFSESDNDSSSSSYEETYYVSE